MMGYKNDKYEIKMEYVLEYLDNEKDLDYVNSGRFRPWEPWELYKEKKFDDIDNAISIFILYLFRDDIYDPKLFETISVNGEVIFERYIEPIPTFKFSLKKSVNKMMEEYILQLEKQLEETEAESNVYKQFALKFEKEFEHWKEEYLNENGGV